MTRVVDVPPGYRAGAWQVGEHIASGSWGSVYAARREDGTEGALKFIAGGLLSPSQYAQLEEARFNEQADHPRLVRTFETFVVDEPSEPALHGAVVVAMERGERNLQDAIGDVDPVPVIVAICEALVHIHARGWVHGDLKPSNVLLMADGSVRLADFGLARELEGTHAYAPRVGSSDFLPPEWWSERISERGIAVRPTVDIWALGVTIHQLLTGGLYPFPGAGPRARGAAAQA
jgi:serine/threonine protein kinase